ncbi:MAG: Ig-like domain-containing protein, partial [Candidatus Nanoarchaeia archaeon]|nr:Ig-like domain-containing protein [Candidatus Nanoarchaeia archaeon]
MKIKRALTSIVMILLVATLVYALSPTININASPGNSVGATVIITSTSYDPDTSGLYNLSIYEDGILNKSVLCSSAQSCTISQTFVHGQSNHSYYAEVYDTTGNVVQSNILNVNFSGLNTPPNFTSPLPNLTLLEDSGLNFNLTDLWQFAEDTHSNDSQLTFAITSQSNQTLVDCTISSNRFVQCNTTGLNATGTSVVNYSVTDQAVGLSPAFTNISTQFITILPVNDPPMFTNLTLPNITVVEDSANTTFNLSDYFYDVDSSLSYTFLMTNPNMSASLFNSTILNITTTNNNTGSSNLTIIASDGNLSINLTRIITVTQVNDPPFFNPILTNQNGIADQLFTYDINASDIDIPTNFTFFDNTTIFVIDPNTGLINFTPTFMINETILITVCDDSNALNNCTSSSFRLNVADLTPPVFGNLTSPTSPQVYNQTVPYVFTIDLSDPAGVGNVSFVIGTQTFTATNVSNTYTVTIPILGVSNYTYSWSFADSIGNANNTPSQNFVVTPTTSTITLFLNGANANLTTSLGSLVNATSNLVGPTNEFVNYFLNGTLLSTILQTSSTLFTNGTSCNLGTCPVIATFNGNQNYTESNATLFVTFTDQNAPTLSGIFASPSSPATYSNLSTHSFSSNIVDDVAVNSVVFTINGVNMTPTQSGFQYSITLGSLAAGNHTISFYADDTSGNFNTTSMIYIVNRASPTITIPVVPTPPFTFGQTTSVSCSIDTAEPTTTFTRNGATITSPDNTASLGAGIYNYTCSSTQTQNFTAASSSSLITINPATSLVNLTLNGFTADLFINNGTNVNMSSELITPTNQFIELYLDGTLLVNSTNTASNVTNFTIPGNYNVTTKFAGNQNFSTFSLTRFVIVGSPVIKSNFTPASGSLLNYSFVFLSFDTATAAVCRYDSNDLPFNSMTTNFPTTGGTSHSGNITGFNLGINNLHVACSNDTATSNADLVYNVTNIFDGSTVSNNVNSVNSIMTGSTIININASGNNATSSFMNDSILTKSRIVSSTVYNSILTNCTVINSTVKGYAASNCVITNSFVDPETTSNLTGSNIDSNSVVMNANVTYSNVTNSTISNSDIDRSSLTGSTINTTLMTNSTITNSQFSNTTVLSGVITNNVITSGAILMFNGSFYDATQFGPANLSDLINIPPTASFTSTPNPVTINNSVSFDASSSTDQNIGTFLSDSIVSYNWDFGDGNIGSG